MKTTFEKSSNMVIVYAELKNKGKDTIILKMALDTGASYTIIPWDVAEKLGCDPAVSKNRIKIMTGSGYEDTPKVKVASISSLGKQINDIEVLVHNLPQGSYIDGLLGLNFFKNSKLSIDFKESIIEVIN